MSTTTPKPKAIQRPISDAKRQTVELYARTATLESSQRAIIVWFNATDYK
jgi:hypothetical protein